MKVMRVAVVGLALLLLVAACKRAGELPEEILAPPEAEESVSESTEEESRESEPESSEEEEVTDDLPDEEDPLAQVRGLPADFDPDNRDHVLEYFIYLLHTGDAEPLSDAEIFQYGWESPYVTVGGIQSLYRSCPYLAEVDLRVAGTEKLGEEGEYRLQVEVADGKGYFRSGQQDWYLHIGYQLMGDGGLTVLRLTDAEKAEAMMEIAGSYSEDLDLMRELMGIAFIGTFDSPQALDPADRTGYLMVHVPPTGTFGEYNMTYISQEDMDLWSERIFGVSPHSDPESRFYDSVSYQGGPEGVYSIYYGWGPPFIEANFVSRVEDGGDVHYYYEVYSYEINGDRTKTLPGQLLRYTVRDGLVWSCVDVSDVIAPSFYLDELVERGE